MKRCLSYILGATIVALSSCNSDDNEINEPTTAMQELSPESLPKVYGVGWGYDISSGYAEQDGIRHQILNPASLAVDFNNGYIVYQTQTNTDSYLCEGESSEQLITSISTKVSVGVDVKVASAKVSTEFSKQFTEQKNRKYVWYRDYRCDKLFALNDDIYVTDKNVVKYDTNEDFRQSINQDTPQAFVEKYGTHLITESNLGGKLDLFFSMSQKVTTETEKVVTTITAKFLFWSSSKQFVDESTWQEVLSDFSAHFYVVGGGSAGEQLNNEMQETVCKGKPMTSQDLFTNWWQCFVDPNIVKYNDLAMVGFKITPIWEVVNAINPTKASAIEKYIIEEYLK